MGATQKIQSYRDLEVWREAMKLAEVCYEATAAFPARETYGLASQIRRAAVSVASNIAEGHSRRTLQAYLNHLSIALGSQSELETQIELSRRLKLVSEALAKEILVKAEQVGRMLHALMRSLEHRQPDNPNT
jgi:four helix bundle protein